MRLSKYNEPGAIPDPARSIYYVWNKNKNSHNRADVTT